MPLTRRQKRRLKELSRMIESTKVTLKDLTEIQSDYIVELEEILTLIRGNQTPKKPEAKISTDLSIFDENQSENSKKTRDNTGEPQSDSNLDLPEPPKDNAPEWAKKLWKRIAMECHPDRLNFQKLTAIDIARRQEWFLESRKLFESEDWDKLIHVGIQLDIWVEEIPLAKQHHILGEEYNKNSNKMGAIQNSIAWQWGNAWDDLNLRIKILTLMCEKSKIKIMSRGEFINLLNKFDRE